MKISNADRVVFPQNGITKGDVVAYYQLVAHRMLPFLRRRALTVERFPKGIAEKGFMQKNAPSHFGDDLIERKEVPKEGGGITVYPVIREVDAISAYANIGAMTFHVPPSTVDNEWHPDWMIWDLDPPANRSDLAREAARAVRHVLDAFEIPTVLMTSGSKGYHLRARIESGPDVKTVARIARSVAALAEAAHPAVVTLAFRKAERGQRVFVDWLRNAPYSTSVAPWSLRARDGAPVAAPISWEDLDSTDPDGVRITEVEERLDNDLWAGHAPVDLSATLPRVEAALDDSGITLEPFDRFRS